MNNKIQVLPLGSCRIYRPFSSNRESVFFNNVFREIEVVYPHCGFFHSIKEMEQLVSFAKYGFPDRALNWVDYLFRKEPEHTTPNNVFSDDLVRNNVIPFQFESFDALLVELSSLDCFYLPSDDLYFHWNPNFVLNVPYSEIYPDGFYSIYRPEFGVVKKTLDEKELIESILNIKKMIGNRKMFITTHIHDQSSYTRAKLYKTAKYASSQVADVIFIDNSDIFLDLGYSFPNQVKDIHHLSALGEMQLGNFIQNEILRSCRYDLK